MLNRNMFIIYVSIAACISVVAVHGEDATIYWSLDEHDTARSCVYSIKGDPQVWVPKLALNAEIFSDPICVNKTEVLIGSLATNPMVTDMLLSYDRRDNGMMYMEMVHDGDLEVFFPGAINVSGIAVDYQSGTIYYTDWQIGLVVVQYAFSKPKFSILLDSLNKPRGILVDPDAGYLFWFEDTMLVRSGMVGEAKTTIIPTVSIYSHIALERENTKLYILDEEDKTLKSYDYDGTLGTELVSDSEIVSGMFTGLTVNQDYIFATLKEESTLVIWDKLNGDKLAHLGFSVNSVTQYGIASSYVQTTTSTSPCATTNGGCDDICIHQPSASRVCRCGLGYRLDMDGTTCISSYLTDKFMLVTDLGSDGLYQVDLQTEDVHTIPIESTYNQRVESVVYDAQSNTVIWIDTGNSTLRSKQLVPGSSENILIKFTEGTIVESISLNPWTGKLYYVDQTNRKIERLDLNTMVVEEVLALPAQQIPFQIKLDYARGYMYWTNVGSPPTIERATLEGANRQIIIDTELKSPSGLAIDINNGKLFFADDELQRIEVSNLDGLDRQMITSSTKTFCLEVDEDYLYTCRTHDIRRYKMSDVPQSTLGPQVFSVLYGLHVYSSDQLPTPTPDVGGGAIKVIDSVVWTGMLSLTVVWNM